MPTQRALTFLAVTAGKPPKTSFRSVAAAAAAPSVPLPAVQAAPLITAISMLVSTLSTAPSLVVRPTRLEDDAPMFLAAKDTLAVTPFRAEDRERQLFARHVHGARNVAQAESGVWCPVFQPERPLAAALRHDVRPAPPKELCTDLRQVAVLLVELHGLWRLRAVEAAFNFPSRKDPLTAAKLASLTPRRRVLPGAVAGLPPAPLRLDRAPRPQSYSAAATTTAIATATGPTASRKSNWHGREVRARDSAM